MIVGDWVSLTVIVNEQVTPGISVQVTVVVPTEKNEPEVGEQFTAPHEPEVIGGG